VNVKDCPQLKRVCFEALQEDTRYGITNALDFRGCPQIAEVRAADNRFTDVIFDDGFVSNVWHLCIHNNTVNQLPIYYNLSRFPNLQDLWIWNDYFQGPLIVNHTNSPFLAGVEAKGNYFSTGDFHNQTNLSHIFLDSNTTLTNLNIAGSSNIFQVSCIDCSLTTSAVDDILTKLDSFGKSTCNTPPSSNLYCYVYNSPGHNYAQPPSATGVAAAESLRNKGWQVFHAPAGTTPNTACIWFTNTSSSVSMKIRADTATSIKWVLANTVITGVTSITTNLGGSYSNAVIVDPASALTGFGVFGGDCSGGGTTLSGVGGLTNYPFLKELHLYQSHLTSLSLAGCANLVSIALVATDPSTNMCNAWFHDLAAAEPNAPCGQPQFNCNQPMYFYFPLTPGTNTADPSDIAHLVSIGWHFAGY
jgi:hypothetical protein